MELTEDDYLRRERENIVEFDGNESADTARRVAEQQLAKQRELFENTKGTVDAL